MINNIEHFILEKYGKQKKRYFAELLWPEAKKETHNDKIALNNKINKLTKCDPRTLRYEFLIKICELLELKKIDKLWLPIKTDK